MGGRIVSAMVGETLCALQDAIFQLDALVTEGKRIRSGKGLTPENARAFDLFLRAGKAGHSEAQFLLYQCYCSGTGVLPNMSEAIAWVQKAAHAGFVQSCIVMWGFFRQGRFPEFPKSEENAIVWLKRAIESDPSLTGRGAGARICDFYEGRNDIAEALKWHKKGVEAGEPDFIYSGFKLCVERRVFETDAPEAYIWFRLTAVETQIAGAAERVNELTKIMSSADVTSADQRFAETHSKYRANL